MVPLSTLFLDWGCSRVGPGEEPGIAIRAINLGSTPASPNSGFFGFTYGDSKIIGTSSPPPPITRRPSRWRRMPGRECVRFSVFFLPLGVALFSVAEAGASPAGARSLNGGLRSPSKPGPRCRSPGEAAADGGDRSRGGTGRWCHGSCRPCRGRAGRRGGGADG